MLVVEDDQAVRETAVDLLRDLGYSVLTAENADSALTIVNSGVKMDILFTDVVMPGTLRSPDLARKAKEKLPDIGVLFTSGYTQNAIVRAGRLDDGVDLISKPYTRERLAQKIFEILERSPKSVQPERPQSMNGGQVPESDGPLNSVRVLLVEDDVLIRIATAEMLADLGHEVVEAGTIAEASELLSSEKLHVMVTDLGLHDGDGKELVRLVSENHPNIAVIVASGADLREHTEDWISGRPITGLVKPYDQRALEVALERCVGR